MVADVNYTALYRHGEKVSCLSQRHQAGTKYSVTVSGFVVATLVAFPTCLATKVATTNHQFKLDRELEYDAYSMQRILIGYNVAGCFRRRPTCP